MIINKETVESVLTVMNINLTKDDTFVIAGGLRDYTDKNGKVYKGINSLIYEGADAKEIYRKHKMRIGTKFYTYKDAVRSIETGFCSRLGLWIPEGFIVIDTDTEEDSEKMIRYLEENNIDTPSFKTNHGYHFIFKDTGSVELQSTKILLKNGIRCDYRLAGKGYIILPTNDSARSVHKCTSTVWDLPYELTPAEIVKAEVVQDKETVESSDAVNTSVSSAGNGGLEMFQEGTRNESLLSVLCKIASQSPMMRNKAYLLAVAQGINQAQCNPPLEEEEVESIVNSAFKYKSKLPKYIRGNSVVKNDLALHILAEAKLVYYLGNWYNYNGAYYEETTDAKLKLTIKNCLKDFPELITMKTINETIELMKPECIKYELDNDHITVSNGLVDLSTFELKEHDYNVFCNFYLPVNYSEDMINGDIYNDERFKNSCFYRYLTTTFDSVEVIRNIQEIMGYSLQPNPKKFQKAIALLGNGSNGKSLFINLLMALHGGNISAVDMRSIYSEKEQNFALHGLVGRKVNLDDDATGTRIVESSNFKKLVTGGVIKVEQKGKQAESAKIDTMLMYCLNNMPSTADTSEGYWRRVEVLEFNRRFYREGEEHGEKDLPVDLDLEDNILENEMDLVLIFALQGLKRIRENKYRLSDCSERKKATEENRFGKDSVYAFNEVRKEGTVKANLSGKQLYGIYEDWCDEAGRTPVTINSFGRDIKRLNPDIEVKKSNGIKLYKNIVVHEEWITKF